MTEERFQLAGKNYQKLVDIVLKHKPDATNDECMEYIERALMMEEK